MTRMQPIEEIPIAEIAAARTLRMAKHYGCVRVVVDAKADAVGFYAKYGFIPLEAVEGQSDARPQASVMFLATRVIERALGARRRVNCS